MTKILFSFAAMTVLSISFASHAEAASHGRSSYSSHARASYSHGNSYRSSYASYGRYGNYPSHGRYGNYHINYGTRFTHGYYYTGRYHNHWSYTRFDARYGCTCYYDPSCSTWYYWCQPASCYYPVSYCPYNTYCWDAATCGSFRTPIVNVVPGAEQGPLTPGGPVAPGPNGPSGPTGPGADTPTIPVGPALNGPAGPAAPVVNGPSAAAPQVNDGSTFQSVVPPMAPPSN